MPCFLRRIRRQTHTLLAESNTSHSYCNQRLSSEVCNMITDAIRAMPSRQQKSSDFFLLNKNTRSYWDRWVLRWKLYGWIIYQTHIRTRFHLFGFPIEQFIINWIKWSLVLWCCNQYNYTSMQKLQYIRCQIVLVFKFTNRTIRSADICHWAKPTIMLSWKHSRCVTQDISTNIQELFLPWCS